MLELIDADLRTDRDSGPQPRPHFVTSQQIIETVRARVEDLAQTRRVRLSVQLGRGGLWSDGHDLAEALGNIAMNAIESSAENDTVIISSSESADGGQLWIVRDSGPGIPSELVARLGTPVASRRRGGSGLGLAVACDIVERHGGLVHIQSAPGAGTQVSIWIPCVSPA